MIENGDFCRERERAEYSWIEWIVWSPTQWGELRIEQFLCKNEKGKNLHLREVTDRMLLSESRIIPYQSFNSVIHISATFYLQASFIFIQQSVCVCERETGRESCMSLAEQDEVKIHWVSIFSIISYLYLILYYKYIIIHELGLGYTTLFIFYLSILLSLMVLGFLGERMFLNLKR